MVAAPEPKDVSDAVARESEHGYQPVSQSQDGGR